MDHTVGQKFEEVPSSWLQNRSLAHCVFRLRCPLNWSCPRSRQTWLSGRQSWGSYNRDWPPPNCSSPLRPLHFRRPNLHLGNSKNHPSYLTDFLFLFSFSSRILRRRFFKVFQVVHQRTSSNTNCVEDSCDIRRSCRDSMSNKVAAMGLEKSEFPVMGFPVPDPTVRALFCSAQINQVGKYSCLDYWSSCIYLVS